MGHFDALSHSPVGGQFFISWVFFGNGVRIMDLSISEAEVGNCEATAAPKNQFFSNYKALNAVRFRHIFGAWRRGLNQHLHILLGPISKFFIDESLFSSNSNGLSSHACKLPWNIIHVTPSVVVAASHRGDGASWLHCQN